MSLPPSIVQLEEVISRRFGRDRAEAVAKLGDVLACDERARQARREAVESAAKEMERTSKKLVCPGCKNMDERFFVTFEHEGQTTCSLCGVVLVESQIRDTEWVRQFEEDAEDKSFHGLPPDSRFSDAANLATGMALGERTSKHSVREMQLRQGEVEMNLSNMTGSSEHRTRQGYKDKMKREMFELMGEVGAAVQLSNNIIRRAQTLFAQIRDATEQLRDADAHGAACVIAALREGVNAEHSQAELVASSSTSTGDAAAAAADASRKRVRLDGGAVSPTSTSGTNGSGPTPDGINRFACKYCGLGFGEKKSLRWHAKECDKRPPASSSNGGGAGDAGAAAS